MVLAVIVRSGLVFFLRLDFFLFLVVLFLRIRLHFLCLFIYLDDIFSDFLQVDFAGDRLDNRFNVKVNAADRGHLQAPGHSTCSRGLLHQFYSRIIPQFINDLQLIQIKLISCPFSPCLSRNRCRCSGNDLRIRLFCLHLRRSCDFLFPIFIDVSIFHFNIDQDLVSGLRHISGGAVIAELFLFQVLAVILGNGNSAQAVILRAGFIRHLRGVIDRIEGHLRQSFQRSFFIIGIIAFHHSLDTAVLKLMGHDLRKRPGKGCLHIRRRHGFSCFFMDPHCGIIRIIIDPFHITVSYPDEEIIAVSAAVHGAQDFYTHRFFVRRTCAAGTSCAFLIVSGSNVEVHHNAVAVHTGSCGIFAYEDISCAAVLTYISEDGNSRSFRSCCCGGDIPVYLYLSSSVVSRFYSVESCCF